MKKAPWRRSKTGDESGTEEEGGNEVEQNNGLDAALNQALEKMRKKLEASVQNRVGGLESRVVNKLAGLETKIPSLAEVTGKTGGERRRSHAEPGYDTASGRRDGDDMRSSSFQRSSAKSESPTRMVRAPTAGNEMKLAHDNSRERERRRGGNGASAAGAASAGDSRSQSRAGAPGASSGRDGRSRGATRPPRGERQDMFAC